MIRLKRPTKTPGVLRNRGKVETQQICEDYVDDQAAYDSGKLKFAFNRNIYGSTEIREVLKKLQHNKCCYCEYKISIGRIDHFRPKGRVRQRRGGDKIHPGYYWLAYKWDNLVLACEECNLKKSDYFPIEDPEQRARNHFDHLDRESPLLLNPYVDPDPSQHIIFDGFDCRPITEKGRVTVCLLKLNRPFLQETRKAIFDILDALCEVTQILNIGDSVRDRARREVDSRARQEACFSGMARDYLSTIGLEN